RNEQTAVNRHALGIRPRGHHPGGASVLLVHRYRKTKMHACVLHADFLPALRAVFAVKHTAMVLLPKVIGLRWALGNKVWVMAPFRFGVGQVFHQHAAIAPGPGLATIGGFEYAGGGNRHI